MVRGLYKVNEGVEDMVCVREVAMYGSSALWNDLIMWFNII